MRVLKRLLGSARGFDDETYADLDTLFGRTRVYDTNDAAGDAVRVLDVEGTWQSGSYVGRRWSELAFAYHRRFEKAIFGSGAPVRRMLMLGGGGLSYPKYVVTHHDDALVDVIEIDPDVIALARRYFFLDRLSPAQARRLRVTCDDAARALAARADGTDGYDVIVNDAFAAFDAPRALNGREGAASAHAALAPRGLYVANVVSALAGDDAAALTGAVDALAGAFAHVWVAPLGADDPEAPDNNVVVATDGAYSFDGALAPSELFG